MREWINAGQGHWTIAVNISALQFAHASLVETVRAALARHDVPPACLTLEVTESTAMRDAEASLAVLKRLPGLGGNAATGRHAAGQGHRGDTVIGNRAAGALAADVGGDERAVRQPGITPGRIQQLRGTHDVLGRLQQEAYGKFHGMMPSTTPNGR
ncbi:hypothetical protein G6F62_014368 [Rhizopus arrhizus]|nr:hypothetical protein G6F62_014368 [Rhizopus arrhizus]